MYFDNARMKYIFDLAMVLQHVPPPKRIRAPDIVDHISIVKAVKQRQDMLNWCTKSSTLVSSCDNIGSPKEVEQQVNSITPTVARSVTTSPKHA